MYEPQEGLCNARMPDYPDKNYRHLCTLPQDHEQPFTLRDEDGEVVVCQHASPEHGAFWEGEWEHPDLKRLREKEESAIAEGYTEGDVNHNIQPIIGTLRRKVNDVAEGKFIAPNILLNVAQMENLIEKMFAACDAETAFLARVRSTCTCMPGEYAVRKGHHSECPVFKILGK